MNTFSSELFKAPTREYAAAYAWVWDTTITKEGILKGLSEMKTAGIGAVYVIPEPREFRPSTDLSDMKPDYLSDEYFGIFKFFSDTAKEMGFSVWLYDEGGWPSGSACKQIAKKRPDLARHHADCIEVHLIKGMTYTPPVNQKSFLAAFSMDKNGVYTRIRNTIEYDENTRVFEYRYLRVPFRVDHNEEFDTDLMNPETAKMFIEMTHERYKKFLGQDFGTFITYIFDDEAAIEPDGWTFGLEKLFFDEYGYDILDYLPHIKNQMPTVTEAEKNAVSDWRKLVSKLIIQNFFKPIQNWCRENGILAIGHIDNDHDLESMILRLPCYAKPLETLRCFDVPGVDVIWRHIYPEGLSPKRMEYSAPFFPRFASSASAQIGSGLALTESLACYGEGTTPEIMRYVFGAQAVRGINVFNCNSFTYSPRPIRPLFSKDRPGYAHLTAINKYLSRLSYLARLGKTECENALYCPCEDVSRGGNADEFHALGTALEKQGCYYDLIDDEFVRKAEIRNGKLCMGLAEYKNVLIPKGANVPSDVSDKLSGFVSDFAPPVVPCSCEHFRLAKRSLSDGSSLYLIFNEDCKLQTGTLGFSENLPAYRLWLEDGRVEPLHSFDLSLEMGETAAILFSSAAPPDIEQPRRPLCAVELGGFTLKKTAEFFSDELGARKVSTECSPAEPAEVGKWKKYFGEDFSGEASYFTEFEAGEILGGDEYELDLGNVEYTASVKLNGTDLGVASWQPFSLRFDGKLLRERNKIEISVANTACNKTVIADIYSYLNHKQIGSLHQISAMFERETLGGGLIGPVVLKKLG
ncbi:MAG: hypothetical protein IKM29_01125 [Clostridia bacterium]|nr:hypothetical protein [Clostridia bacterium]